MAQCASKIVVAGLVRFAFMAPTGSARRKRKRSRLTEGEQEQPELETSSTQTSAVAEPPTLPVVVNLAPAASSSLGSQQLSTFFLGEYVIWCCPSFARELEAFSHSVVSNLES